MTQVVKRADLSKKGPKLLKIATIATFWTKIAFSHFFKPQNRTTKGCESHLKPARIRASKTALFAINRTIWKPWVKFSFSFHLRQTNWDESLLLKEPRVRFSSNFGNTDEVNDNLTILLAGDSGKRDEVLTCKGGWTGEGVDPDRN